MTRWAIIGFSVLMTLGVISEDPKGVGSLGVRTPDPFQSAERHFAGLKQLTFGGQNAEAYFSSDGTKLIFQSTRPPFKCDQIFTMNVDGSDVRLVSTGKGRTTCSFLFPDGKALIYSSTHL